MKPLLLVLALALAVVGTFLIGVPACGALEDRPRARNVVLIVSDTQRRDRLGCYGYPRDVSPRIDSLAARGVLYENNHSQACWTLPSMISLMAGLPVTQRETALPRLPVLAEELHRQGLTTAAFLANPTVGVDRGFERGFDHFEELYDQRAPGVAAGFANWLAGRDLEPRDPDAPGFFAWVHFIDAHHPYTPDAAHDVYDGPRPDREQLLQRWRSAQTRVAALSPDLEPASFEEALRRIDVDSNHYDGEIRAVDEGVGIVLDALEAAGVTGETLVIFCSDHGEMLYEQEHYPFLLQNHVQEHGGLPDGVKDLFVAGHRPWYYETLWRTPLIFAGPGFPAGARRQGLAANLDIFPTILESLDTRSLPWLAGESLFGGRVPGREAVFAYGHMTTAVLDSRGRKLILHTPRMFVLPEGEPAPLHLYDLSDDPEERQEASARRPDVVRELEASVERWREQHRRDVIETTTPEALKILAEMGYVDAAEEAADRGSDE